jgi:hypothetical protein
LITEDQIALQIDKINKSNVGFHLNVPKGNIKILPVKGALVPKYKIQIESAELTYNLKSLLDLFGFSGDTNDLSKINIKETVGLMTLIYEPTNSYLAFNTMREFKVNTKIPDEKKGELSVNAGFESLTTSDINISVLLNTKDKLPKDIYNKIMVDNPSYEIVLNNFEANFTPEKPKNEFTSFKVELKQIKLDSDYSPKLISAIYDNVSDINYNDFAKKGAKINRGKAELENLKYTLNNKEGTVGVFYLESLNVGFKLQPSDTSEGMLKTSLDYDIKGVKFKNYTSKDKELVKFENVADLRQAKINVSLDKLSPELLAIYVDVVKELEKTVNNNPDYFVQYLEANFPKIKNKFLETEPILKFNINPINHNIFQAKANGYLHFDKNAPLSVVGKLTSEVKDIESVKQNLLKNKLATKEEIDLAMKDLNNIYVKDGDGNLKSVFEIKKEPPFFFLNGKALK